MNKAAAPANLIAFPSVSSSLHSLPHATSMQNVSIHPSMYAQRAAESQAKLQKALSNNASSQASQNQPPTPVYLVPASPQSPDPSTVMMKRPKSKYQS